MLEILKNFYCKNFFWILRLICFRLLYFVLLSISIICPYSYLKKLRSGIILFKTETPQKSLNQSFVWTLFLRIRIYGKFCGDKILKISQKDNECFLKFFQQYFFLSLNLKLKKNPADFTYFNALELLCSFSPK